MQLHTIIVILFTGIVSTYNAQEIVASDGGFYSGISGSLSWTLGEPITETYPNGSTIFTQGFQQNYEEFLGTEELNEDLLFSIYPNPCSNSIQLYTDYNSSFTITIIDQTGRTVQTSAFELSDGVLSYTIDVSELTAGSYLIMIGFSDTNKTITKRFVKTTYD